LNPVPLLSLKNISVELAGRTVTRGVSLDIARGESLALVGESGSGKTITARVITGLIDRIGGVVSSGDMHFDGVPLRQGDDSWGSIRGKRIAMVPQASLSSLDPVIRIGKQIDETVRFLDPGTATGARSRELLDQVRMPRISEVLRSFPHELSGGMRQRVMIALALAGRPELMVADEPTTALDVTVQASILRLLKELRAETGMSLLMIAHDLAVVGLVSERVSVMRDGEILETGATADVLTNPQNPYTVALLAARPESATPGKPLAILDRTTGELRDPAPVTPVDTDDRVIVSLQNVSLTYRNAAKPAVATMSLDVSSGDAIGIVGESGSGKSTLGRMLVGALPPTAGKVMLDGEAWDSARRLGQRRREIQMIFQDPFGSLTPWRTPRETVAEVIRRWQPLSARAAAAAAGDLLDEVGLPLQAMDRRPIGLSGGQCQRVGIARALATEPRMIVADEPTSALDISAQAQILNLLMRLRATHGLALVLISHDLTVIRHMTSHAVVMKGGEVVEAGPSEQLFINPQNPYTQQLIASTPVLPSIAGTRQNKYRRGQ
jgi:peptide/nickel transport system ATP-binding protein